MLVLDGRARFDEQAAFRTWLFGVIRGVAIARGRRERLRAFLRVRNESRIGRPSPPPMQDDDAIGADRSVRIRRALEQLSARQREALHLVFYHGMTIDDAARVMCISLGSARVHYHRGKTRMAILLAADAP